MALTTEQILLLENLMYMEPEEGRPFQKADSFEGQSVGEWLNSFDISDITDSGDNIPMTTADEWKNIINAVKQDETLMNMTILTTHEDYASGGGGGRSAVFVSESTGDAVVAFKGTETTAEWVDNFIGGNVPETNHQKNALKWYQDTYKEYQLGDYEVTVTGHSKGGNKAKYITLMDDTVDHCVSFDGQGFSDEFMDTYADEIAARQGKIENHNVDYDYVNILLNDVGETTYYKGYDLGSGGFLENHCPNTYMNFSPDGSFTMSPTAQGKEMQALDNFLNNMLRSMPDSQQTQTLEFIAGIVNGAFALDENANTTDLISMLMEYATDPRYSDDLSYMIAYFIKYEQTNPEMAEQIKSVLEQFGMGDLAHYVDIVDGIFNFKVDTWFGPIDFNWIMGLVGGISGFLSDKLPNWVLDRLRDWIRDQYGIELTNDQLRALLKIVAMTADDLGKIDIKDDGADKSVPSSETASGASGGPAVIRVDCDKIDLASTNLQVLAQTVGQLCGSVENEANNLSFTIRSSPSVRKSIQSATNDLRMIENKLLILSERLDNISKLYNNTESKNASILTH